MFFFLSLLLLDSVEAKFGLQHRTTSQNHIHEWRAKLLEVLPIYLWIYCYKTRKQRWITRCQLVVEANIRKTPALLVEVCNKITPTSARKVFVDVCSVSSCINFTMHPNHAKLNGKKAVVNWDIW